MVGSIDYGALAARLRSAYVLRADRTDRERADGLAAGKVALDDVLRHLDTAAAAPLVDELTARASALLETHQRLRRANPDPLDVFGDRVLPPDPFDRALTRAMIGSDPWLREVDPASVPRLVIEALASSTDHGGLLDPDAVRERLGPLGAQILAAAQAGLTAFRPGTERPKLKYEGLSHAAKSKVALSAARRTFAARMPAFTALVDALPGKAPFAGFTMASVQHLFPSTMALYDALRAGGLERPATGVGGKNYSANPDVTARMMAEGWDVAWQAHPTPQEAGLDAEATVYEMARQQLRNLFKGCNPRKETQPRFLILDDGGKLLRALHDHFPEYAHLCVGVEQTDRGIQVIEKMAAEGIELKLPVVDMARSPVKKAFEAPMIGEAIVTNTLAALDAASAGLSIEPATATVVGFGAIGGATAQALLRRGFEVNVIDPSPKAQAAAEALGCVTGDRDALLARGQLLVSCTGQTTITPEEYDKLPNGCVLVNGASGNHELGLHEVSADFFARTDEIAHRTDAARLVTSFGGRDLDLGDALGDEAMRHRVVRSEEDHEVMVLRSGYVINMTDGLPPEYVQLVLGLLYAACHQAAGLGAPDQGEARTTGLVPLDASVTDALRAGTESALAKIGHRLDAPDFSRLDSWRL